MRTLRSPVSGSITRRGVAVAAVAVVLAGCGAGQRGPAPAVTPLVAPTPATTAPTPSARTPGPAATTPAMSPAATAPGAPAAAPFVAPDEADALDAAALERILQALHEVEGGGERALLEHGEATAETTAYLSATRSPRGERVHREILAQATFGADDRRARGLHPVPGDRVVVDVRLLEVTAGGSCVWLEAEEDLSDIVIDARRTSIIYYALVAKDDRRDPDGLNPTPWVIEWQGGHPDRVAIDPPPDSRCP